MSWSAVIAESLPALSSHCINLLMVPGADVNDSVKWRRVKFRSSKPRVFSFRAVGASPNLHLTP